jgi:hypothetical protein
MSSGISPVSWLWKLAVCSVAYATGAVLGGMLAMALSLDLPRVPGPVDQALQGILLFPAGLVYSIGLAAMAIGLVGRWWQRWFLLVAFLFVINGIGNAIEGTLFTTLGGQVGAAVAFLVPSVTCAFAVALLFPTPSGMSLAQKFSGFLARSKPVPLAGRVLIAILAFPVIYLAFGGIVAPIVVPYYEALDFLKIPPLSTLIPVAHVRSVLLLLVSLPIIIGWEGSRARLILGLGLGHAAAVGVGGLVQATFFPSVLRWVHGVEIFADSMVYAWVLVLLFADKSRKAGEVG